MIEPGTFELPTMIKGTTYDQDLTIFVNDTAKNLTGCTATLELFQEGSSIGTLTSGSGLTLGTTNGVISIGLSATATAAYAEGTMTYTLEITESDTTTIYRYAEGTIPVRS